MALAPALAELQAEARCPLCLDTLREPVTLDCGHNCCDSCLQQRWEDLLDTLPCPMCQHRCPRRNVKRNSQLALLADLVRQLPSKKMKRDDQEPRGRCDAHQQPLSLFCEEDLELLCGQCGASAVHQGHILTPMGQAAAHHRRKLKGSLERLRQQLEEAERGQQRERAKSRELREKVEKQRSDLCSAAEHLKVHLKSEQEALESGLKEEVELTTVSLRSFRAQLSDHGSALSSLLRDVTKHYLQRDQDLLLGLEKVQLLASKCESLKLPQLLGWQLSKAVPTLPPHDIGLQNMIRKFQVDFTLDPETAHPSLTISPDRRTAVFYPGIVKRPCVPHPRAFITHPAVLGSEGFEAGRHYWQVKIQGSGVWSLGVCRESFPRHSLITQSASNGCWKLQQPTHQTQGHQGSSTRIGVFLDFELGQLSFYNLCTRSRLCTLTDTFKEKLRPYFFAAPTSVTFNMSLFRENAD